MIDMDRQGMICGPTICRYRRSYSKRTRHWFPVPIKVPKHYSYVGDIQRKVIDRRLADDQPVVRKIEKEADDARLIKPNLAPIPPPPTQELVQTNQSRLGKRHWSLSVQPADTETSVSSRQRRESLSDLPHTAAGDNTSIACSKISASPQDQLAISGMSEFSI